MIKEQLINSILTYLKLELANSEQAASNAHLAATDDQSVAETQYDTLAIESAYLAEGQSRRILEFNKGISAFEKLLLNITNNNSTVALGSLVQVHQDSSHQHWFFIGPAAGGYRCQIADQHYTVVTPQSPMGKALLGKQLDDEINIRLGNNALIDDIVAII